MNLLELAYAFFNTPGVGGAVVMIVYTGALVLYFYLTRWILRGGKGKHEAPAHGDGKGEAQ